MNNLAIKSLLYIFFSFLIISTSIFFFNNNFAIDNYLLTLRYTYHELMGLVLFISQFIYILNGHSKTNKDVVIHSTICCLIFVIFDFFFIDYDYVSLVKNSVIDFHIDRDDVYTQGIFILESIKFKEMYNHVHNWDIKEYIALSSFSLFLFNLSVLVSLDRLFKFNTILKVLAIILTFLFNLYIWNYQLNILIIILSFVLLINIKERH